MKFQIKLPKLSSHIRQTSTSRTQRRPSYDAGTVETWNELRVIGSEAVHKRLMGVQDQESEVTLQEGHDWDYYIAQFNEQYRQQLREGGKEGDRDSVSTLVSTQSKLMESRKQRLGVYRRLFIISNLLLWVIFLLAQYNWFYLYNIWPIGFLSKTTSHSVTAHYFTYKWKWAAFIINCHTWLIGSLGLLCAFCFRERPAVLRQFIIRLPYVLLVPTVLVYIAVKFTGTFSTQLLSRILDTAISRYYDETAATNHQNLLRQLESRRNWDQLQKLLKCCGIQKASDWESVDVDVTDDKTYIPESCCARDFFRRAWTREKRPKDDCYYKINKEIFEWTYPDGCLNLAQEFFVKMGAFLVGIMVCNFCALLMCLCFGKQYYTMIKKVSDIRFKYSWKQWMIDILFLNTVIKLFTKRSCKCNFNCRKAKHAQAAKRKTITSVLTDSSVPIELDSQTTIIEKGNLQLPSVIITAPKDYPPLETKKPEIGREPSTLQLHAGRPIAGDTPIRNAATSVSTLASIVNDDDGGDDAIKTIFKPSETSIATTVDETKKKTNKTRKK